MGVAFNPDPISCPITAPGAKATVNTSCGVLSAPASVTAKITDDTSGGALSVALVTSYVIEEKLEAPDPGEVLHGPGKPIPVFIPVPVAHGDGVNPLAVQSGQYVEVTVQFAPTATTPDSSTATLIVDGGTRWAPISIPVTAVVGFLAVAHPSITVTQGQSVTVDVAVESVRGPATTVQLILTAEASADAPNVAATLGQTSSPLGRGQVFTTTLNVSAPATLTAEVYSWALAVWAYGKAYSFSVSIPIVVRAVDVANPLTAGGKVQTLLILAPDEFMPALEPLVAHKNKTGMPTNAIAISKLKPYFEGRDDPAIIKRAIRYAYENLSTKYVMLAGDAHSVPVRYMFMHLLSHSYELGGPIVPTNGAYIPLDNYYVNLYHHTGTYPGLENGGFDDWDANGNGLYNEGTWLDPHALTTSNPDQVDGFPDLVVARVPAHTAQDLTAYVNKIIYYETSTRTPRFTFVADEQYPGATNDVASVVKNSGVSVSNYLEIETPPVASGWVGAAATEVATAASTSTWVGYIGHGGPHEWGHSGSFFRRFRRPVDKYHQSAPGCFCGGMRDRTIHDRTPLERHRIP